MLCTPGTAMDHYVTVCLSVSTNVWDTYMCRMSAALAELFVEVFLRSKVASLDISTTLPSFEPLNVSAVCMLGVEG